MVKIGGALISPPFFPLLLTTEKKEKKEKAKIRSANVVVARGGEGKDQKNLRGKKKGGF